jgi:hypothetical protein
MSLLNSTNSGMVVSRSGTSGSFARSAGKRLLFKDIPAVFLSYDEPNANINFDKLKKSHPNPDMIRRVHGVKGLDAAHKACAAHAIDNRFFTIDGDCSVEPAIWEQFLDLEPTDLHCTFSWSSRNIINGLVYGNGGVKLWYAPYVLNMRTHEAADPTDNDNNVDFCWDAKNYKQMNTTYGTVMNNGSAFQAFRAGFREGVKMGLDQGHKVPVEEFKNKMYPGNYARWLIWMTVGRDVVNGFWAMYGARIGAHKLYIENFDQSLISDYDWFNEYWNNIYSGVSNHEGHANEILKELKEQLNLPLVELTADQSTWFKHVNISPPKNFGWNAMLNHSALPLFGFVEPKWT